MVSKCEPSPASSARSISLSKRRAAAITPSLKSLLATLLPIADRIRAPRIGDGKTVQGRVDLACGAGRVVVCKSRPPRCRSQAPDSSIDLKPDSLALHPALADSGPASRSIRFGIEDWRLSRAGRPQAQGRLWIARTQEASPPDARNTACRSRCFPLSLPQRGTRKPGFGSGQMCESELSYLWGPVIFSREDCKLVISDSGIAKTAGSFHFDFDRKSLQLRSL